MNARNFSFWDGQWWKRTDAAVTVCIGIPVYLRSCDVTVCLDGPTAPMKHKRSLVFGSPPSTPIQRFQVIEPLVFDMPETQKRKKLDVIDLTSDNENDVFQTTGSSRSSNTKAIKFEAAELIVCISSHSSPQSSGTITVKFKAAFDTDFTSTMFYDNLNKWKALSSEMRHQIVALGRVQEAEHFAQAFPAGRKIYSSSGSNVHKSGFLQACKQSIHFKALQLLPPWRPFEAALLLLSFSNNMWTKKPRILRTHCGCDLRPSPKTVEAAVELFKTEGVHVDWDIVQDTQSREVENVIRTLGHQGILMVPVQDSPLSSVPRTPIQGPTGIGMQDVVPPISGDDVITVNAADNNVNIADAGGAVHSINPNKGSVGSYNVTGITAHNWHGPFEEFEESWPLGGVPPESAQKDDLAGRVMLVFRPVEEKNKVHHLILWPSEEESAKDEGQSFSGESSGEDKMHVDPPAYSAHHIIPAPPPPSVAPIAPPPITPQLLTG
ncbi:hypothetical protein B0H17DRAFT_1126647 [Mycena rosella]|uniref:Uncharacterized protein n=1 Tax=Mycena rosella TaxID=1033263 RepID=A0AAD7M7X1_MYCRO|nr:hypothetical protein B0H17DRAFT_1126647 [Mycena rosella]